jgi:hypothetical protein
MFNYNPQNWYWIVGESTTQVYSSVRKEYIPITDDNYVAWINGGNQPSNISNNDMILMQIDWLEDSVTTRMIREQLSGATSVFPVGNIFAGLTSAQAIASINTQIVALRGQLTS